MSAGPSQPLDSPPPYPHPPPLPARSLPSSHQLGANSYPSPGYDKDKWISAPDPRSSSSQSLRSAVSVHEQRRTLLLVYIHGFYGNKQSFRSFPHHVHSFLRSALSDTHVIHSKIYPRYKTYRAIEVARDNFSEWLIPHESPTTDVILVGHSMGGILSAEVVLMPNRHPYHSHPFKHRILGTISLDSPFLGLHPGIIVAGLSSIFQPAPEPPGEGHGSAASRSGEPPLMAPPNRQGTTDPYFDPPFWNDNPFKEAPFIKRIMNFTKKHRAEGLFSATTNHIVSHLEYGGCLADFSGLRKRYDRVRSLEDVDELEALSTENTHSVPPQGTQQQGPTARVRFVNYYTLSSGRPPKPKPVDQPAASQPNLAPTPSSSQSINVTDSTLSRELTRDTSMGASAVSISVEDYSDHGEPASSGPTTALGSDEIAKPVDPAPSAPPPDQMQDRGSIHSDFNRLSMQEIDPIPMIDNDEEQIASPISPISIADPLPPVPDEPVKPVEPDLEQYADKDTRKQVEREHRRQTKTYEKAVKDRNRALREREKLIEKRRKKALSQQERGNESDGGSSISSVNSDALTETQQHQLLSWQQGMEERAQRGDGSLLSYTDGGSSISTRAIDEVMAAPEPAPAGVPVQEEDKADGKKKEKKKKKFCTLPSKVDGAKDPTWVDVYMDGMDEVGAHCGLFFPGPHYDRLVGDFSSRIIGWVQDDLTKRAILDMHQGALA